jgi:hypothetical protein
MSFSDVRTAVKNTLEAMTTIGSPKVQDYRRHAISWEKIAAAFLDNSNRINVWIIEWSGVAPELIATGSRVYRYPHSIRLWGLYGLRDDTATGKTFEDYCDLILDEFNGTEKLESGTTKARIVQDAPASLEDFDEAEFVGVLCHRARIRLNYEEQRAYS